MTTPTADVTALLAAIELHPDDDTPRLLLADAVQEAGDDDRAELIRVQVEKVRLIASGYHCYHDLTRPDHCEVCRRNKRESALLAKHPEWLVPCPVCENKSEYRVYCDFCNHSGRVGTLERGLLGCVPVPVLGTVMARLCTICGWEDNRHNRPECAGEHKWLPIPWASRVFSSPWNRCARVECGDRVPLEVFPRVWCWSRWLPSEDEPHRIPDAVFDCMSSAERIDYDTPADAALAAGLALGAWLRKNVKLAAADKEEKK